MPAESCSTTSAAAVQPVGSLAPDRPAAGKSTYGQILKSSAMIGGSSVMNIAIGIVRTKAMALMLGPAGVGLMGLYGSILDLALSVAAMGINSSGVRQIAESVGTGDERRIARTVTVLRRVAVVLGVFGAVLVLAFCRPIASVTFGSDEYAPAVALLSLAVFFRLVSDGQGALIQGMRRIADLAKMGVLGALLGTAISIPLVYTLGTDGVVPALIAIAATSLALSWWYSRKVRIDPPAMTAAEVGREATALLRLGVAFMVSGLLVMGTAYAVRTMILRLDGVEAAGFYQAAWTLGGLYVGIILQAMGADFYPRLTGVAGDNAECNRLVNEQAQVSLLLAGPGVIATITLSPLVITLFYSAEFSQSVEILRWICLGMILRVISWPMGFIILAKNAQKLFLGSEIAWTIVHVGLAWICINSFGAKGAGMAFFGSYVFHAIMIYTIVHWFTGFRWSSENKRIGSIFIFLIGLVFIALSVLPPMWGTLIGISAVLASGIYSIRALLSLVAIDRVPQRVEKILLMLGLSSKISKSRA